MKSFYGFFVLFLVLSACEPSLSEKEIRHYREQGDEIVKSASEKLSGTLMSKMKEGGATEAIGFCHQSALPITKKMGAYHDVDIKRTSLKIRNPENLPSEEELKVLLYYEDKLVEGKELNPLVSLDPSGRPSYYAPIRVQKKCLMCHGTPKQEVSSAIDSILKVKYPEDLAIGYKEGDLRGIWSISFPQIE